MFLVSGGFRELIEPVAKELNISSEDIFANQLRFDKTSGEYAGFDESQPTSESGGKPRVIAMVKEKYSIDEVTMIGDGNSAPPPPKNSIMHNKVTHHHPIGATDLEARPPASYFIGFGGNVAREKVKEGADHFVYHFDELSALLR